MKKNILFILIAIISILFSCAKSKGIAMVDTPTALVYIEPDLGACPCCGFGYNVIRIDSADFLKCYSIPPNTIINHLPDTVRITFHDTTSQLCRHNIVIDQIYPYP
jgi:hypothetical protein